MDEPKGRSLRGGARGAEPKYKFMYMYDHCEC